MVMVAMSETTLDCIPRDVILIIIHAGGHELIFTCHKHLDMTHSERLDMMISYGISVRITRLSIEWSLNGAVHRYGDLPAIERTNGVLAWHKHGLIFRAGDLPNVISKSEKQWRMAPYGFHRTGGPAIIYADGRERYFLYGREVTREQVIMPLLYPPPRM